MQAANMTEQTTIEALIHNQFTHYFGKQPTALYSAPGRVNIIGEHTDYNDGFVLPAAINFRTWIGATRREDGIIEAIALDETDANNTPLKTRFSLHEKIEKDPNAPWSDYLRGVVVELLSAGFSLCGANLVIKGNVPRGAGLSSSAALETVIVRTLTNLSGEFIDGPSAAKIGQAAENNFAGCQCGIMDQMVSCVGQQDSAVLLDCRNLETQSIPLPQDSALVIINSNIKRGLVDSEYNTRREQCEQACEHLKQESLRDVSLQQLHAARDTMSPLAYKRALHVLTENQRTLDASKALANNDYKKLSQLMYDSHESMKNDFEITVPAIDDLVDIIRNEIGDQGGVRMTGGGFGGCVVTLVPQHMTHQVINAVEQKYSKISGGLTADIFICTASNGAFFVDQVLA